MSMRAPLWIGCGFAILFLSGVVLWADRDQVQGEAASIDDLVHRLAVAAEESNAVQIDPTTQGLIDSLRRRGVSGLEKLLDYRRGQSSAKAVTSAEVQRLDQLIDRVAGCRFASQSGLYWHTSMDQAKAEAIRQNRPILSLRLLGRLDEDLSCANSRMFRTLLYPDPLVRQRLQENFVLHWQSVREVPVVTIDFGRGRGLRQTLTGNSVHLVLDPQGRPIEALPGLVNPEAFFHWLVEAGNLYAKLEGHDDRADWQRITQYHGRRAALRRKQTPASVRASETAADLNPLDTRWSELAQVYHGRPLSAETHQILEHQLTPVAAAPPAEAAMPLAMTKAVVESPLLRMVRTLETSAAQDTAFNLHGLQPIIDGWFAATAAQDFPDSMQYDALTRRIYAEVFLMPLDDPWLGLSPASAPALLDGGGRVELINQRSTPRTVLK